MKMIKPRNINDSLSCPGCGVKFQSDEPESKGYLKDDKLIEVKRRISYYKSEKGERRLSRKHIHAMLFFK